MKRYFIIVFFILSFCKLNASHIVGGEIYYDHLGGSNYRITLKVYRDCVNGIPPLDGLVDFVNGTPYVDPTLTVFDGSGNYLSQILLPTPVVNLIPPTINNGCITPPGTVCLEEGVYTKTVSLPPRVGGYYVVYQRCCRGATSLNIFNANVGATYYTHITGSELTSNNSSPRFINLPPIFVCNGRPIGFNHAATDPDGDQLVYSLCAPFEGLSNCCGSVPMGGANPTVAPCAANCPPANAPPYNLVTYLAPYSGSYPMSSSPAININPTTGFLNGTPNLNGQWVVGVCVSEYRAGVLIGTQYRDYLYTVDNCIIPIQSIIQSQLATQTTVCQGNPINFTNQSVGGPVFHWDFGVTTLTNDTSNLISPSYMYPDTGKYIVTLIVNPGKTCADTSTAVFYVYPLLAPTFVVPPPQCVKNNNFNFTVGGSFASYSTFNWSFGPYASPSTSTVQSPTGITYSVAGQFVVGITVKEAICSVTFTDVVFVNQNPGIIFDTTAYTVCDRKALTLTNTDTTSLPTTYVWQFSDGTTLYGFEPTHVFTPPGVYNVTVSIITNYGCIDTTNFKIAPFIRVNPAPIANFSFTPTSTTIFDPDIYFTDQSSGATSLYYSFGDGTGSSSANPSNHYNNYGDFNVTQTVKNNFNCIDTITKVVKILPEFRFWIPNCFTPRNKDSLNDIFKPSVIGVEEYEFLIYDRWGERIFKTNDISVGWDGTFQGKLCETDVYIWLVDFKNVVSLRREQHAGSVTLLR